MPLKHVLRTMLINNRKGTFSRTKRHEEINKEASIVSVEFATRDQDKPHLFQFGEIPSGRTDNFLCIGEAQNKSLDFKETYKYARILKGKQRSATTLGYLDFFHAIPPRNLLSR